jgi:hypothetical protein
VWETDAGRRTKKMIGRSLTLRLERLESRLVPAGEPMVINVHFVSADGSRVGGVRYTVPRAGGWPGTPTWQNHQGQHP